MTTSVLRSDYFPTAFVVSLCGHALLFYVIIFGVGMHAAIPPNVVYSVTLESGSTRGGITQIPQTDKKTPVAPPKQVSSEAEADTVNKKERVAPAEPDAEVSLAEKREQELLKQKEAERKKAEEKKLADEKKKVEEKKKEEERKKAEEKKKADAAKPKALTSAQLDKAFRDAMQRYTGESTNAGGVGFGAAGGVGKGMGGGILKPPEWFLYKDKLESSVRQGWKWHNPNANLRAEVMFAISPSGVVSDVSISTASGNSYFDESVVRAVMKASPVPPPPAQFYDDFKLVIVEFKPQ